MKIFILLALLLSSCGMMTQEEPAITHKKGENICYFYGRPLSLVIAGDAYEGYPFYALDKHGLLYTIDSAGIIDDVFCEAER